MIDLPEPVSPVRRFSPRPNSTSRESIRATFLIFSRLSIARRSSAVRVRLAQKNIEQYRRCRGKITWGQKAPPPFQICRERKWRPAETPFPGLPVSSLSGGLFYRKEVPPVHRLLNSPN